ncbi:MAG TPA: molybdopterin-dependent oxidoreductase [Gemmataceae bacterium]|nr:molybdopterin-dependent oxidoreductase [Gemmataceae bacterium]
MADKLDTLIRYLDGLQGRAGLAELTEQLRLLKLDARDVANFLRFDEPTYQRVLVRAGRWYHLWVLCWKNGQRSPIHDHLGSSCGVRVLRGTATITDFAFSANGHVKAVGSRDYPAGSVFGNEDADLHQLSNLQAGSADLITLHVYSPPLLRMGTYSLTERTRGEEVWLESRKMVTTSPENSETPLESIQGWVTPNSLFFVRNHFETPVIDLPSWRLRVEGCVERLAEWTWEQLLALPQRSVFATVECAGNGRSFLQQKVAGVQWGAGAIGHAEWTGVPLYRILEQAGVRPEAVEVLFEGCDRGSEADHPEPMPFARSLPMDKALDRDTLLATRMNGELLNASHGFPLRLFVPGWYGVASVKWLRRIEVLDRPFHGYYQSVKYTVQRNTPSGTETVVVGAMAVKSELIRPAAGAELGIGTNRLFGVAWAGEEAVGRVEVSINDGRTWNTAELLGPATPYCWTPWEYLWEVAEPGDYSLLTRAVSVSGHVQPLRHDPLNGGYLIHHSRPIPVHVQRGVPAHAQRGDAETLLYDMNAYAEENRRVPLDVELEFAAGGGI